jgi:hypothetical protein
MISVSTRREFRSSTNPSSVGPLDAAERWAAEHARQGTAALFETPMLLFNEELGTAERSWRQMVAVEVTTLFDTMRGSATPQFLHEILPLGDARVPAPVKLALDCELKYGDEEALAKAEAAFGTRDVEQLCGMCAQLYELIVAAILELLSPLVGRELTRDHLVELTATRRGKWSTHIVVDGYDAACDSVAFESNRDCAEFVRRVIAHPTLAAYHDAVELIVDRGIYAERHPLRTYYSAKRANAQAWLRLLTRETEPCDVDVLAASLRTCFRLHTTPSELSFYHQSASGPRLVTSAYLMERPDLLAATPPLRLCERRMSAFLRAPTTATATPLLAATAGRTDAPVDTSGVAVAALFRAIATAPEFADYDVRPSAGGIKFRSSYAVIVNCKTLTCSAHESGAHSRGHQCVYLWIDLLHRNYTQLCSSANCKAARAERPPRARAVPPSVSEAIGDFLCSPDWAPGERVGADFAAALAGGGGGPSVHAQ